MWVLVGQESRILRTHVRGPVVRIGKEESLLRSKAADVLRTRFSFHRFLKRRVRDRQATQIGNRLTDNQLALLVESFLDFVAAELIDDALGALVKCFAIVRSPPIGQIALGVKLASLVVKSMR